MEILSGRRRVRDALILAVGWIRRAVGLTQKGKRVIAFHDVRDFEAFRQKMVWLAAHYDIVSMEGLIDRPLGEKAQVAITFDDGYACWHETVMPILEELGLPATFFVCSGFVGLNGAAAIDFARHYLRRQRALRPIDRAQLQALADHRLFEIGGHTVHHVNLGRRLDEEMLAAEISGDKSRLEAWTDKPVRWFAYPFGGPQHVSARAVEFVREGGFRGAFTLVPGSWRSGDDVFRVGRDSLDVRQSVRLWRAWLSGAYDSLYAFKAYGLGRREEALGKIESFGRSRRT